jgi:hypothetical protein
MMVPLKASRSTIAGQSLGSVKALVRPLKASVHMPRIGCGLAGGPWQEIEPLIRRNLTDRSISVTVCDHDS